MPRNDRNQPLGRSRGSGITFINLSHPDDVRRRDVQAGIRRHVMTDIGRSRRKKPQHVVIPLEIDMLQANSGLLQPKEHSMDGQNVPHELDAACPPEAQSPHQLRQLNQLGIFGVDLDNRTLQIVHLLKTESEYRYEPFHIIWVRMGFSDPTALHISMATTLLFWNRRNNIPIHRIVDNIEAAKYYSKALKELSKRLSNPSDRTSPGVIATIIGCLCHDVKLGHWESWSTHVDGLDRVFELRGGTDGLENHIPLLAFWLDLVGRAALDIPPRFPIPKELAALNPPVEGMPPALRSLLHYTCLAFPQLSPISDVLCIMSSVVQVVNSKSHSLDFWRDGVGAVSLLGPVTHHLLSLSTTSEARGEASGTSIVGELVRLTCLMLLSHLKGLFYLNTLDMVPLYAKFMATAAQSTGDEEADLLNDLKLWAVVSSAILQSSDNRRVLLPYIRAAMRSKGTPNMPSAIELAKSLIWLDVVEGQREAQLAEEVDGNRAI
ncbi:hypothetical protein ACJZ2D_004270 [Fusarium nematophilum]